MVPLPLAIASKISARCEIDLSLGVLTVKVVLMCWRRVILYMHFSSYVKFILI